MRGNLLVGLVVGHVGAFAQIWDVEVKRENRPVAIQLTRLHVVLGQVIRVLVGFCNPLENSVFGVQLTLLDLGHEVGQADALLEATQVFVVGTPEIRLVVDVVTAF
jgi:hypothetical protein